MKKRIYCMLLSVLMVLGTLLPAFKVSAEDRAKNITPNVNITEFKILNGQGQELNKTSRWSRFKIKLVWDAKKYGNALKNGDYFEIELPDNFRFIEDSAAVNFPIYGVDGTTVFGQGKITVKKTGGGTVRVTLNEKVENLYNVKGTVSMEASFNQDKITLGGKNKFIIELNGKKHETEVEIGKPGSVENEILAKWANRIHDKVDELSWTARINVKKDKFKKVVFEDELNVTEGSFDGLRYKRGSFELRKVEIDKFGNVKKTFWKKNVSDKIKFSNNFTKFRYEFGDINGEQYILTYRSTYKPNVKVKNILKMFSQGKTHISQSEYKSAISNGTIEGDLLGKIKIIKVDSENNQLLLKGAKFKITNKATNKTFELVTNDNGEAVSEKLIQGTYKIEEIQAPAGWIKNEDIIEVEVKDDVAVIKTITNKREKTEVSVNKTWIGKKASSVKVNLLADGTKVAEVTLNEQNNWKHTFKNLNKFKDDGKTEIKYTVEEEQINGYDKEIKENSKNNFTIINKSNEKVKIPVEKKWEDNNNQDGKRVKEIVVRLLQDGIPTTKVLKLNEQNNWKGEFTDLDKYNAQGNEIKYTVKEETVVEGYDTEIIAGQVDGALGYIIKNKHNVEKTEIPVEKRWVGPASVEEVTVKLFANDKDTGKTLTLKKSENWKGKFTNLDKYKDGKKIVYTIKEVKVDGYDSKVEGSAENGFVITNKNVAKTKIPVEKKWEDNNNQDGKRVKEIIVKLVKNDVPTDKTIKLNEQNNWKGEFTDLDKYDAQGNEIKYTVKEETVVEGYDTEIVAGHVDGAAGFIIKNKHNVEKTEIPVEKRWVGPASVEEVTVKLFANDEDTGKTLTLKKSENWKGKFTNLDKYKDGKKIVYTIKEVKVDGYDSKVEGSAENGFVITNKNVAKTEVSVEKKWLGKAVEEIEVKLLADGKEVQTAKLNEANSWKHTFKDLPVYDENGKEIEYTVKEVAIDGYESKIEGNAKDGFVITNKNLAKTEVSVEKKWLGKAVDEIEVKLLADGKEVQTAKLNEANSWKHTFKDLPVYDDNGKEITYTVKEVAIEGYESKIEGNAKDGFVITNKNLAKTQVPVEKKWIGKAVNEIEVKLLANGKEVQTAKLNEANSWKHTFKDLPVYDENGKEIVYTVKEVAIEGYESKIEGNAKDGFIITNRNVEKTEIPVEKKWIGKVLKEIEVQLLANGKEIQNVKLNEGNSWKHTFKDLPVYDDNGKEITYTVKEVAIEGYESKIEGNAKDGFVITNKEIPKKPRIPKTAVGTQIFGYVAMAGVSLGLLQISRKKRNK
ncbi:Cna B-type domain-containing protein [Parvimonas micra]|nr:Cna B-type domain-containing protein [Parvimonas micra]WBB38583.1 Cna B-type domain-containing protein [Parvimonas micra]